MEEEKHPLVVPVKNSLSTGCKVLIVVAIAVPTLLFLASVGGLVGLSVSGLTGKCNDETTTTCTTPACVKLASTVLSNMNPEIDPCEDFFNYSCGGWVARNVVPSGYGSWGVFQELAKQNTIFIDKLITGTVDGSINAIKLTRDLFNSCLDLDGLKTIGASPLIEIINVTGGWELVNIKNSSAPKWSLDSVNFLSSVMYGNPAYFSFSIAVDDKNSSQYIASLEQSGITLPSRDSYLNQNQSKTMIPALRNYIVSTLSLLDPTADKDALTQAANQIIALETELAKIFVSNVELRNIDTSYNPFILSSNLSDGSLWQQFNWTTFIPDAFETAEIDIDDDLLVIVRTPSYFANLTEVYNKFNDSVHENYFNWQLVNAYITYLGEDFLDNYYDYSTIVSGSGKIDRYLTCISVLESIAPFSVSRLYTEYVLPNGTRGNVSAMVQEIKDTFEARLDENEWLDDVTRERSKWKVGNITAMIAYPNGIYNETVLNEETKVIDQAGGVLFDTAILYNAKEYQDNFKQYGKPVDKTGWEIAPTVVNAYYEPLYNGFVFLEGILNKPFFDAAWPEYFNYGAFGVVIGHELTHGFDDQGQRYNQNGVLTPWWSQKSIDEFNKRKACFVEQYGKFSMFGVNINGNLTLGENIADNGGVHTSYQAYKTITKDKDLPGLPGIDLSPDELFFVAYGQVWCSLFTEQFIKSDLSVNPHSPGPYRIIGALQNSEDFASVYKCPSESRMNPKNKCDLW